LDAGLYTAVSTIGTREKIATGDLDRLYDLAAGWGVGELRVLAPVASGGAAGCQSFMLWPEDRQALYDFHVRRNRAGAGPAVASFAYLESEDMFGCGAGYHHLFIDAAGEACPCDLTPLSMGNACREPLAEIWARMAQYFPRPRTRCLMGHVAAMLEQGDAKLPLPRETSEEILAAIPRDGGLPGAYKRLLK
jgi:MoaA/NifB/PqqE/SkfB family radical SAM enzyme